MNHTFFQNRLCIQHQYVSLASGRISPFALSTTGAAEADWLHRTRYPTEKHSGMDVGLMDAQGETRAMQPRDQQGSQVIAISLMQTGQLQLVQ